MSEPVTDVEIEDVLSSIRRLITEDGATKSRSAMAMTDRFVLTPALRVMDGGSSKPKNGSSLDAAKDAAEGERAEPASPANETEWEHVTEGGTGTASPFRTSRLALEARIAELEAAVARSREEWEPDGSEPEARELPSRHLFAPSDTDDLADVVEPATEPASRPATVAGKRPDPTVGGSRSEGAESGNSDKPAAGAASDEEVIDEEFLREFVAEIVRQELQGELGERITRNVRRMVRREIQQAMALKGLD